MSTAHPAEAVAVDLDRGRSAFSDALRSRDLVAVSALYADDATLVAPAGEILHGRAAIEGFWRTGLEIGIADAVFEVLEVERRGDVAFEVGAFALHMALDVGRETISRGRYLIVHRLDSNGRWERAAEMFSPDPAPVHAGVSGTSSASPTRPRA